jgi:hypothetical protein
MMEAVERILASLIVLAMLILVFFIAFPTKETPKNDGDFLELVSDTKRNLSALSDYAENQAEIVRSTKEVLSDMQRRRDELEPALKADLKAVEALIRVQEERAARDAWNERWISFFVGVLSSAVVSLLGAVAVRWFGKAERKLL